MEHHSHRYYTALLPDNATCEQFNRWARMAGNALGKDAFLLQHPANYHVTTGLFNDENLPSTFPEPKAPGLPAFKAASLEGGAGKAAFDLYYRKSTGECCLTLAFPFPEAEKWLKAASANPLPPHVTLGKFTTGDYSTPEAREKLKTDITEGNPPFQDFPKLLEQIQWEYGGSKCSFATHYTAPAKPQRLAVTSLPMMQRPSEIFRF